MNRNYINSFLVLLGATLVMACSKSKSNYSSKTGYPYNKKEYGAFQKANNYKRSIAPGLIPIEGGQFVIGGSAQDIPAQDKSKFNYRKEVTVNSFYMDETEVSNADWLDYVHWVGANYPKDAEYNYEILPDTLVWRSPLSYNEPYVDNYFRHPAYQDYPVVGVTWEQAQKYCVWRTDRVNEFALREKGIMASFKDRKKDQKQYNTDLYLNNQIDDKGKKAPADLNAQGQKATRTARLEDGVIFQPYRLPTEAEWEYAALGLIGSTKYENISEKKIYPWKGLNISSPKRKTRGQILANFKRSRGDYMGVGGSLNDKGSITMPVISYEPNDFGLYNIAGNVNEWVQDVYRKETFKDAESLSPFRGNVFQDKARDGNNKIEIQKDRNLPVMTPAIAGKKQTWAEVQAKAKDSSYVSDQRGAEDEQNSLYGTITLVNNKSRVYKGGSWNDQAQWLNPAARRFKQQDESAADLGFRCAMTMLGASEINPHGKGKQYFKERSSKVSKIRKK